VADWICLSTSPSGVALGNFIGTARSSFSWIALVCGETSGSGAGLASGDDFGSGEDESSAEDFASGQNLLSGEDLPFCGSCASPAAANASEVIAPSRSKPATHNACLMSDNTHNPPAQRSIARPRLHIRLSGAQCFLHNQQYGDVRTDTTSGPSVLGVH